MTSPLRNQPNNQHCPEEIREVPLPHDECSEPVPGWREAHLRYRRLSLQADLAQWGHALTPEPEFSSFYRFGLGAIFRPFDYTPVGVFGLGVQVDTNFQNEVLALGRIQTSFNIQRHGRERITLAALGGIRHLIGQDRLTEGSSAPQPVTGTLGVLGGELALESRLVRWLTLVPYLGVQYSFAGSVDGDLSGPDQRLGPSLDLIVGARITFDLFPVGEAPFF